MDKRKRVLIIRSHQAIGLYILSKLINDRSMGPRFGSGFLSDSRSKASRPFQTWPLGCDAFNGRLVNEFGVESDIV
jgi:hypothetical protein